MITFSAISILSNSFKSTRTTTTFSLHTFAPSFDPTESLLCFLRLSIQQNSLTLTHQSHAKAHRLGLTQHPLIAQKLITSSSQFNRPFDAKLVFDSLLVKNVHLCNTLLSGYGKNRIFKESLVLFREMCEGSMLPSPDDFTFSSMFKILGDSGEVGMGRMVHGRGVKNGFLLDTVVGNSLLSMYGRSGCFDDAYKVFDEMPLRNVSSWNALISGYAKANFKCGNQTFDGDTLWKFVEGMQREGFDFDAFTVSILLSLCGGNGRSDDCGYKCSRGKELHCYIVKKGLDLKSGLDGDLHLGSCLIDMYSKMGKAYIGRRVFDRLKLKNVISWTAMINGYVRCGQFDEALFLFRKMQWEAGLGANKVALVTILPACSSLSGLIGVKQIHGFAVRMELIHESSLCNALIDTYSKCGNLDYATQVFNHQCIDKDAISWSSLICGYGLHGQGEHAVLLFDEMLQDGIEPDTTVVVAVLSACSKSGLTKEGIRIYESIVENHRIKPTVEICACVVDILGRSGQLDRALEFIKNMAVEPGPSIWGALLCASAEHGDSEMQELAYKSLIQIEPDNSSNYVSLSNLCAASKRWDVVADIRKGMREKGLRKVPGCSWISISSTTHSFVVGDKLHPCSELIYGVLDELLCTMKLTSCHNHPHEVYLMDELDS